MGAGRGKVATRFAESLQNWSGGRELNIERETHDLGLMRLFTDC